MEKTIDEEVDIRIQQKTERLAERNIRSENLTVFRATSATPCIRPCSEVEPDNDEGKLSKRFLYLTKLLTHFWNRWRREYMTDLREYHKLSDCKTVPVKKGQIVLLQEENVKRGQWKVAVVDDVIYGKDGEPRGAVVRKSPGKRGRLELLHRPLQKLYPLEISTHGNAKETSVELAKQDEQGGVREENEKDDRTRRAAAKDARWKSKLMLDP